jgi:hypothetical protein
MELDGLLNPNTNAGMTTNMAGTASPDSSKSATENSAIIDVSTTNTQKV